MIDSVQFSIKVVGEVTGDDFPGVFECRPVLTHAQQLERDRLRREFLGTQPDGASQRAENAASIFSELAIRLTKAPKWWTNSNNGLELFDDNVIAAIYTEVIRIQEAHIAKVKEKMEQAKKELKELPKD